MLASRSAYSREGVPTRTGHRAAVMQDMRLNEGVNCLHLTFCTLSCFLMSFFTCTVCKFKIHTPLKAHLHTSFILIVRAAWLSEGSPLPYLDRNEEDARKPLHRELPIGHPAEHRVEGMGIRCA
jgi:hypothetical protein